MSRERDERDVGSPVNERTDRGENKDEDRVSGRARTLAECLGIVGSFEAPGKRR